MNSQEAIKVLNDHKHNGARWFPGFTYEGVGNVWCEWITPTGGNLQHAMPAFDAIAIAEKIQRESL